MTSTYVLLKYFGWNNPGAKEATCLFLEKDNATEAPPVKLSILSVTSSYSFLDGLVYPINLYDGVLKTEGWDLCYQVTFSLFNLFTARPICRLSLAFSTVWHNSLGKSVFGMSHST